MRLIQEHFIFNALNSMKAAFILHKDEAPDLFGYFATYLRYQFYVLEKSIDVPCKREVETMEAFLALERLRYSRLNLQVDMEEENLILPALCLQMLYTDGIHHCMSKKAGSFVSLSGKREGNYYVIRIEDDGGASGTKDMENRAYVLSEVKRTGWEFSYYTNEKNVVCLRKEIEEQG